MVSLKFSLPVLLVVSILFISQGIAQGAPGKTAEAANSHTSGVIDTQLAESGSSGPLVSNQVPGDSSSGLKLLNDPDYDKQWSLRTIRLPVSTQVASMDAPGVVVAVLDTGIDKNQEDLKDRVAAEIDLTGNSSSGDVNGHGTFIGGIISADADNGLGIAGIDPASRLLNVKVVNDRGQSQPSTVAEGIRWALENGAKVINISIEFNEPSPELEEAINLAWAKGAVIVAAASNRTVDPVYPASYEHCISVAATDEKDQLSPLTYNQGWIDVAAPGISIYSTLPGNNYGYKSGTSFATAHVSGLAALLFSTAIDKNGDGRLNDEVRAAIEKGARYTSSDKIKRIDVMGSLAAINSNN